MLLFIAVLAFASAAFLLFRYLKRQDPELLSPNTVSIDPPANARPLFAPTDEDLRRDSESEKARSIARREYRAKSAARAAVDAALSEWRSSPSRRNAAELLRVTIESGLEGDFSRAAAEIVEAFHTKGIDGLTAVELAALLDSHLQLLSNPERASGTMFWLKQEAAKLRSEIDVS